MLRQAIATFPLRVSRFLYHAANATCGNGRETDAGAPPEDAEIAVLSRTEHGERASGKAGRWRRGHHLEGEEIGGRVSLAVCRSARRADARGMNRCASGKALLYLARVGIAAAAAWGDAARGPRVVGRGAGSHRAAQEALDRSAARYRQADWQGCRNRLGTCLSRTHRGLERGAMGCAAGGAYAVRLRETQMTKH